MGKEDSHLRRNRKVPMEHLRRLLADYVLPAEASGGSLLDLDDLANWLADRLRMFPGWDDRGVMTVICGDATQPGLLADYYRDVSKVRGQKGRSMNCLFFDIETIVDESRLPLFEEDLNDKAREMAERVARDIVGGIGATEFSELAREKRDLLGAVTPEYCRVIGMNLGFDDATPRSGWVGEVRNGGEPLTERDLLEAFWSSAKQAKHLVGFNCNRFDLPAIYVRSALLGVEPTVDIFSKKPWDWFTLDLMQLRWPYRAGSQFQSLKALRRILQLEIPSGYEDVLALDGGDVGALWAAGDFEKCRLYGELDILTTRELCRHWGGFFFSQVLEKA